MHYSPHSVATNGWGQSNSFAPRNSKLVRSAGIWKSNPWWQLRRKNPWNSNLCSENFQQSMSSRYRSTASIFIFRLDKNSPTSGICSQWKFHRHNTNEKQIRRSLIIKFISGQKNRHHGPKRTIEGTNQPSTPQFLKSKKVNKGNLLPTVSEKNVESDSHEEKVFHFKTGSDQ
jgi:hypothetical protein